MKNSFFRVYFDSRHRTVVIASFLGMLSVLGLMLFQVYEVHGWNTEQAQHNAVNLSRILEQQATATFQKVDLGLLSVNRLIEAKGFKYQWSAERYHDLLAQTAKEIPEIKAFKILDQDGFYRGESDGNGTLPTINNRDRKYFQIQKDNPEAGLVISEPVISKTSGVWVIVLCRRLPSPDNKFRGVILATVSLKQFETMYSTLEIDSHGSIALLSFKDKILLAQFPKVEAELGKKFNLAPTLETAINLDTTIGYTRTASAKNQMPTMFGFSQNTQYDIALIVSLAEADYLEVWRKRLVYMLVTATLVVFGFAVLLRKFLLSIESSDLQKLLLADSAKMSTLGEMASGIAHEINNPLTIIRGRSRNLRKTLLLPNIDVPAALEVLTKIDETISRIARIVRGLQSFSRQADDDPMIKIELDQIIQNTLALCTEKIQKSKVLFKIEKTPEVIIQCKETQISQVLLNLLSNALDAALEANTENSQKWVELNFRVNKSKVQIRVSDSGNGVSFEVEKKMMQPFFTTKPPGKGTGLGLSISKGIIEDHHGRLFLDREQKHTQFVCELEIDAPATAVLFVNNFETQTTHDVSKKASGG